MQAYPIVDCYMNASLLAAMKFCQGNYGVRSHAMCPFRHPVKHMLNMRVSQVSCHHFPSVWKNIGIMDCHITSGQIYLEIFRKFLHHLDCSLYNLHKRDSRSRRRIVAEGQQLITARLSPNYEGRAMVGAEDSLFHHVIWNTGRHTI